MNDYICQECCHFKLNENSKCHCTENKVIGCMYINLVNGCIYMDPITKKRCKEKRFTVITSEMETELYVCERHKNTMILSKKKNETFNSCLVLFIKLLICNKNLSFYSSKVLTKKIINVKNYF